MGAIGVHVAKTVDIVGERERVHEGKEEKEEECRTSADGATVSRRISNVGNGIHACDSCIAHA